MHNVKKLSASAREIAAEKSRARAENYNALSREALKCRKDSKFDAASLDATQAVLSLNSDFATLWGFRREVLRALHPDSGDATKDAASRRAACENEFKLTQECLTANPKSYPVWFHRTWVVEWGRTDWQWNMELKLTAKMLALDDRNFHCWTYRRFVVRVAGVTPVEELKFSTEKIMANFSNYSAWHYRSKLLPQIYSSTAPASKLPPLAQVLRDELELLRNAFFTAPEDQSAWFYHRWLLAQLKAMLPNERSGDDEGGEPSITAADAFKPVLQGELDMVKELLELEPGSKWPLVTAAFLHAELGGPGDELHAQLQELKRVDPMRACRYDDMRAVQGSK